MAAQGKGLLNAADRIVWKNASTSLGDVALDSHNHETAKRCFLRILAWPGLGVVERVHGLYCMARFHMERKAWVKVVECCEEAPGFSRNPGRRNMPGRTEEKLFLLLADAYEGQGGMRRAREYDTKAFTFGVRAAAMSLVLSSWLLSAGLLWNSWRQESQTKPVRP